ncbi:MAG TPA: S8 family serine peptidase [Actinomycetota bacterium]|nr:S8 family serine peptidase [Actinomycetota bacterium]
MSRRVLVGSLLALSVVALSLGPASARPSGPAGPASAAERPILTDRDGDRLDDILERRIRKGTDRSRFDVVVATDGSLSVSEARGAVGHFAVSRRLGIIDGFSATLGAGQIRVLARTPGVVRIDHDAIVRATMDAARADYGVEAARAAFGLTGAGVDVCILDTGVDAAHEQLDSKDVVWQDFVGGLAEPYDDHGHGTHVASIAVGDGTGSSRAAQLGGVAPEAGLWAGKVLNAEGSGTESEIVAGIDWCAEAPEVDVISMSLGTLFPSDGSDALSVAANNAVLAHGKVVTAAAGNSGDAPDTIGAPGAAADVITIGAASSWSAAPDATNHADGIFLAPFSSRGGPTFEGDQKPDVVTPGVNVDAAEANTGGYVVHSGTSMATPFAAGAVALALEAAPSWSPDEVQAAMEGTAEDYGPAGKDPDWGAGLVDVHALAALATGGSGETVFPAHVHLSEVVPDGGSWVHDFEVAEEDLGVPIAASIVIDGECVFPFPGFGCLDPSWSPDLDAKLFDPNGELLDISQCSYEAPASEDPHVDRCGFGRQETVHSMPTVAGIYTLEVYAYLGSPNDGAGGAIEVDLSTGPAGGGTPPPPPPPTPTELHVGDLDRASSWLTSTTWQARVTIRVHDEDEALVSGVLVTGRWGNKGSVQCTTNGNGSCSITRSLRKSRTSIAFTVLNLSKTSFTYVAADNHDEVDDDGSAGTRITVNRP